MTITLDKIYQKVELDGKKLTYLKTDTSLKPETGKYIDIYRDDKGQLYKVDRIENAIKFTTHPRHTGEGNMISFSINLKNLLNSANSNCDDEELDRCIKKCEHPLSKALAAYTKEQPDIAEDLYEKALQEKVNETVDEVTLKEYTAKNIADMERILSFQRMQDNKLFCQAMSNKLDTMKAAEDESELV